ncbi:MAG: prepilin-type N-terminal cleavage/methylation domain-containing protein [Planctomycetota bacterium]
MTQRAATAFTLVEVLLALALLSLVLTGTIGVLESGGARERLLLAETQAYALLPQPLPAERRAWEAMIASLPGKAALRSAGGDRGAGGTWSWFHWRHELDGQAVHIRLLVRVLP